jgi:two-component system, OmpR family, sensor kinase
MRVRVPVRLPLRTRVLAGVLLVTLAALSAFDLAALTALRGYLLTQTDRQLTDVRSLYRPLDPVIAAAGPFGRATVVGPFGIPDRKKVISLVHKLPRGARPKQLTISGPHLVLRPALLDQFYVEYFHGGPKLTAVIGGNRNLRPDLPARGHQLKLHPNGETVLSENGHDELRLQSVRLAGGTLVVTTSLSGAYRTTDRMELILIVGSLCAVLLVAGGVALVLRRGMRPIEAMAAQADRITAGDLTDRVSADDVGTEVGRLGAALNGMLTRIETSVREREASQELTNRFFADASHELRTPLASLRANAELYQQGAISEPAQVAETMRRIAVESQRMGKLVDDMLRLARLDQHPAQQRELVDLTSLLRECGDEARGADPLRDWHLRIDPDLAVIGDAELLWRAIGNLLVNIGSHTPAGARAAIIARRVGEDIQVVVSDTGPGVRADQLARIFDRFYRTSVPRPGSSPGSGLGLAIVAAVAAAHHGAVAATSTPPHGLAVTLTLPAATAAELEQSDSASVTASVTTACGSPRVTASRPT